MSANPPFSTRLHHMEFAVMLRLTDRRVLDKGGAAGRWVLGGLATHTAPPKLPPPGGGQQPQSGKTPRNFERIPKQFAPEKNLSDQPCGFAVSTRMAYTIHRANKRQRFEGFASPLEIFAYEHMAAENLSKVVRIHRSDPCGQLVQRCPDDVRCPTVLGKIGIFVDQPASVAPNIAVPHVPAVLSQVGGNETRQTAADEIVVIHNHHVTGFVGF